MLGEFDLQAAFAGAGAGRKDVEDEGGAVDDLDAEGLFEVALLGRRQFVVEDDDVGAVQADGFGNFLHFAAADVGGRVGVVDPLGEAGDDLRAGGAGELGELVQRFVGGEEGAGDLGSDEDGAVAGRRGGMERTGHMNLAYRAGGGPANGRTATASRTMPRGGACLPRAGHRAW
ncbi:hypothetical protein O0235_00895 [Tepidiforma flava]|uniref:Uncharacterized protein n=1 Tax=Tepidiforma flava TaxID=3004094 RepID=A0ABY7M6Q5_9CHLR|nr:hypothetical protein [Tepidiforma flava]WBL36204.1 hypothetical protein O0235_00895 [Tepidiforma flava]